MSQKTPLTDTDKEIIFSRGVRAAARAAGISREAMYARLKTAGMRPPHALDKRKERLDTDAGCYIPSENEIAFWKELFRTKDWIKKRLSEYRPGRDSSIKVTSAATHRNGG